jgi:hypothetical protein
MTKKLRLYQKDRALNSDEFNEVVAPLGDLINPPTDIQLELLKEFDHYSLDKEQFHKHQKGYLIEEAQLRALPLSQHEIYHSITGVDQDFNPERLNPLIKPPVKYLDNTYLCGRIEDQKLWILNSKDQISDVERELIDIAPNRNIFINFPQVLMLAADEIITNGIHAHDDFTPPERQHFGVEFQYMKSEKEVCIMITDYAGKLTPEIIFRYMSRDKEELEYEQKERGAGLGLLLLFHNCTRMIVNIKENKFTQVMVIFNRVKRNKVYYSKGKDFHLIFDQEKK